MTNLVGICYVISNVYCISREDFNQMTSKNHTSNEEFVIEKSKFILLEIVDLTILMTDEKTAIARLERKNSIKLTYSALP
jgi:hypothetical protein